MDPNINVFVKALRDGKSSSQALTEYCWAKCVVPIDMSERERRGCSPMDMPPHSQSFSEACGWDAFQEGATDDEIEAAFKEGLRLDREVYQIGWRVMKKEERPRPEDLLRAMSVEEQLTAAKFFGLKNVAMAVASGPRNGRELRASPLPR